MSRLLLLCVVAVSPLSVGLAGDDSRTITVHVVTADGKPAVGAHVWAYPVTEPSAEPKPLVTDAKGGVRVKLPIASQSSLRRTHQAFARDAAGRMGQTWLEQPFGAADTADHVRLMLLDATETTGRVTTTDGRPVAGAEVVPLSFQFAERSQRMPEGHPFSLQLPTWEQVRQAGRTDAAGRFRLPAPNGYDRIFRVKATGLDQSQWYVRASAVADVKLAVPGTVAITMTGIDPAALKGADWALRATDRTTGPTMAIGYQFGKFDGTGALTLRGVRPGRYVFSVPNRPSVPGVARAIAPFAIVSGGTAAVKVVFGPAASVTGKVTDAATGRGVAGVKLFVQVRTASEGRPRYLGEVETAADGTYTIHGPAGWFILGMRAAPDGYTVPRPKQGQQGLVEPARVEVGKSHACPAIALPPAVSLTGQVVFPDGKPAVGAVVRNDNGIITPGYHADFVTTDAAGRFLLKNLPADDAVAPRVRLGSAVNVPQAFELERTKGPVKIVIRPENAVRLTGRVVDGRGNPVAGARVELSQSIQGVGRSARYGITSVQAVATTGPDGHFEFAGLWPNDRYSTKITAAGFGEASTPQLVGNPGATQELALVRLARANLAVTGTVVGADGAAIAGVELFAVDGPVRVTAISAADGRFTLSGVRENGGFVFARKTGYRFVAVPAVPGGSMTITLTKADAPPLVVAMPPDHAAAQVKFMRHLFALIWDNRAALNYGGNALEDMTRIDPATARRWRDQEKKRPGGKDFTRSLERGERTRTLFDTARKDIDEAVAALQKTRGQDGFWEAYRLGERLLAVDKAKAARMAEEAAVRARQSGPPAKVWLLAEAGDLAARAGRAASGRKLIEEAANLAEKLGTTSHDTLARGIAASRLAPFDWPRAKTMLDAIRDPSEHNRFLATAVAYLATVDLPRAKQLLAEFQPDGSFYRHEARVRMAARIALKQPDEAIALVDGVDEAAFRFLGYVRLATILAPTDRARTVKLIDTAFNLLDRDENAFRSWRNFGGRAAFAAVGAVRAQQIGHPDVAGLIARTLAMRPSGQDNWSTPEERDNQTVNIAAVLALIDPMTARHLLATVAPPDDYVRRALKQRRDWLFALALADPERATVLADRLMERAKTDRSAGNALSRTGLVELGSILTARDRLTALTDYGSLPREVRDEE